MAQRKYPSMMSKAEWVAPTNLKVGDLAVVLHSYNSRSPDANFGDLLCGVTTVTRIKKNGTAVLLNGMEFSSDGYGLAKNNACVLSTRHALDRTADGKLPVDADGKSITRPAIRDGHHCDF